MLDAKKAFGMIKSSEIRFVDLKFTDLRGTWQHMTLSARDFTMENVQKGYGFDGSSIRGFNTIYDSDMLLKPDMETIFIDPFFEATLSCICTIHDPLTEKPFGKDPRYTAMKAEEYLKKTGIGDVSYWGPEVEFFVLEKLHVELSPYMSSIGIVSNELSSGMNQAEGDGYVINTKSGYFPVPPFDKLQIFRSEMVTILESIGIIVEVHHHEVASAGQVEIDMRFDSLVKMADKVMIYKYVARNLAKKYGMTVTFLPKPIYGDNGSGMHTNQSIFKAGKNVFFDKKGYGEISKLAESYVAGLLSNLPAILGITNPTVNSYRRLVPHFEAPTSIAFSARNRSAAIRIPMYFKNMEKSKRLELRCPDPTCNPYLSFAAQLVMGLHGIKNKMDPRKMGFGPYDENIWEKGDVKQTPNNLSSTLEALERDAILAKSGVFTAEQLASYIDVKKSEATQVLMYPTPADFYYYGDM